MSYVTNALIVCNAAQVSLADEWQAEAPMGADEMTPLEDVLMSPANSRGIQQRMTNDRGKTPKVEVDYSPRWLENEYEDGVANPRCSGGELRGDFTKEYTMPTTYLGPTTPLQYTAEDFADYCRNDVARVLRDINAMVDGLERTIATQHAQEFALLAGNWGTGIFTTGNAVGNVNSSNEYIVQTLKSGGDPYPQGLTQLRIARMKAGLGNVVGFGGSDMWSYLETLAIGCCSDSGIDLLASLNRNGLSYGYDKRLEDAMASSAKFMLYRLGSALPLYLTKANWRTGKPGVVEGSNYTHTGISSPKFGIPMDLTITDNCGTVTIAVATATKLIGTPTDQFQTGDLYFGINGIAKGLITNPS